MRPDFATCGADFLNKSDGIYSKYVYHGPVQGILNSASSVLITVDGCKELCGNGSPAYYPWSEAAETITTWVCSTASPSIHKNPDCHFPGSTDHWAAGPVTL